MLEILSKSSQNTKKVHFNPMCIRSRAMKYSWIFWQNSVINFFLNVKWISLVFLCKITLHLGLKFSFFNLNMGWIPSKSVINVQKSGWNSVEYFARFLLNLGENSAWIAFEIQSKVCQKKGILTPYVLKVERGIPVEFCLFLVPFNTNLIVFNPNLSWRS